LTLTHYDVHVFDV